MSVRYLRDISRLWPHEPTAYLQLSLWHRRRVDLLIHWRSVACGAGLRAMLVFFALELAVLSTTWQLDLTGVMRDLMRLFPVLALWLWLAVQRRRHLVEEFSR